MSCREKHAVNNRLIFAFLCWYKQLLPLKVLFHDEFALHKFSKEDFIAVVINITRHKPTARSLTMLEISETDAPTAAQIVAKVGDKTICTMATRLNKVRELVNLLVQLIELSIVFLIIDQIWCFKL